MCGFMLCCHSLKFLIILSLTLNVWAIKYKFCNFGNYAYMLNALIFAFKSGFAQCKQRMVKFIADNLKF